MRASSAVHGTLLVLALAAVGCGAPEDTADRGEPVRLPRGDAERGRTTFEHMHCWACHGAVGFDFPPPVATPPTGVTLGARWKRRLSDQELTDAIVDPSHTIDAGYADGVIRNGPASRMGSFDDVEVGQLVDLVAFLREVNDRALAGR